MVTGTEKEIRRILITGGCGFIGTSLVSYLLNNYTNIRIRILDNLSVGTRGDLSEVCNFHEVDSSRLSSDISYHKVELIVGDIREPDVCLLCCRDTDAVVHLAAQSGVPVSVANPLLDCAINVSGTLNMLESCRKNGVDAFVFASSGAPLGEVEPPVHEEKVPHPVSPYGASKLAGEAYCSSYYKTFGIKTVVLRFGNVYGPRSQHKTSIVAKFFQRALNGHPLEIYGDGTQTRDFIYIDDLCSAISLSLEALGIVENSNSHLLIDSRTAAGEIFQIATFRETAVSEIAVKIKAIIEGETGSTVEIVHGKKRIGDVQRNYADTRKAKNLLGFEPVFDLDAGLYETYKSFARGPRQLSNANT
jgi:UDP-glucose 4-epimerase